MNNRTLPFIIAFLAPSIMLHALAMDIFIPCVPSMTSALNTSHSKIQWVLSIFVLSSGLGQIFLGILTDKIGRKIVMLTSILTFCISSILCAIAKNADFLIFARFFQGVGSCGAMVAAFAIVRDLYSDKQLPKIYSYLTGTIGLVPMLAPFIGGYLFVWFNAWQASFYFLIIFSAIVYFVNHNILEETKPIDTYNHNTLRDYKTIFSNKSFLIYAFCGATGLTALFLYFSISSILLIKLLGVKEENFGFYFGLNALVYLFSNLICAKIQENLDNKKTSILGSILIITGATVMFLLSIYIKLNILIVVLPNLIITVGVGFTFGPSRAAAMIPFKENAGKATAAYGTIQYCLAAIVAAIAMLFPITSAMPLAITMFILGSINIILLNNC